MVWLGRNLTQAGLLRRSIRCYSSTRGPFKVLFFGRDAFSCTVLQQLLQAKGG